MGEGPPLVMLHGSPGDSAMLHAEMAACSGRFTCFALDTPGFGGSDPLHLESLTVHDLASATAAAMEALCLPPCRIYGTHTGAAIGVELASGWPERVSGAVLEGLPIFTPDEIERLLKGVEPIVFDPLGAHLTQTWMRFRDQFTWFPWHAREVERLNSIDRPTAEAIDHWVSMFYRSCKTYQPAYRAILSYGHGAFDAAEASRTPTVYMASAEDMLFLHLDRLPPLKSGQGIERLDDDQAAKVQAIRTFADGLPGGREAPAPRRSEMVGADPARRLIDGPNGQVFVRTYGDASKPALVMLHDAPGTGLALQALARHLVADAYVIVPDLPGIGESDAPPVDQPILEAASDAIFAIVDSLGLKHLSIVALGAGCAVAALVAAKGDPRLGVVILKDVPEPDEATAAAIAPDLPLTPEGSHWIKAWLMLRDQEIYRPWFDGGVSAQRKTQGCFDAEWLHDQTVALMKSRATYHRLPRAAYRFDNRTAFQHAGAPVHIVDQDDASDLAAFVRSTLLKTGTNL